MNFPYLMTWLEKLAQDWNRRGVDRIPVRTDPLVAWSQTGELIPGDVNKTVGLSAQFNHQIQVHTITFDGLNNDVDPGSSQAPRCQAHISWFVKGVTIRRIIDVGDGVSISGIAQGVDVVVRDATPVSPPSGSPYRIGIGIAPGVRPNSETPPTLSPVGVLDSAPTVPVYYNVGVPAGQSVMWTIPPDCGAISSYIVVFDAETPKVLTDADLVISVIARSSTVLSQYGVGGLFKFVPLGMGAKTIEFHNNSTDLLVASCLIGIQG